MVTFNVPPQDVRLGSGSAHIPGERSWLTTLSPPLLLTHIKIVSIQTIHYIALSVFIPPLLSLFAEQSSLNYEGGAANVGTAPCLGLSRTGSDSEYLGFTGMVMDWREMAGRPTFQGWDREDRWDGYGGSWSGDRELDHKGANDQQWSGIDPVRGWIIALCWLMASCVE